jgi:hypothetical protein
MAEDGLSAILSLLIGSPGPGNKHPFAALHHVSSFGIKGQMAGLDMWQPGSLDHGSKILISISLPYKIEEITKYMD